MIPALRNAPELASRIIANLPNVEDQKAATSLEEKKELRRRFYTEDIYIARDLIAAVSLTVVTDYDLARDAENTVKVTVILQTTLIGMSSPLLLRAEHAASAVFTLPDIVGSFDFAGVMPVLRGADGLLHEARHRLLEGLKQKFGALAYHIAALVSADPRFATALTEAFRQTAYDIVPREAAAPSLLPAPPEMPPPTEAPQLWADRPPRMKAAQFLRETYAPWIEAGVMTRAALKACDKALYHAYHVWVHRHPEDTVPLKDTPQPHFIADAVDAIERRRAAGRASKAKVRARAQVKTSDFHSADLAASFDAAATAANDASVPGTLDPVPALPAEAPKLWQDRASGVRPAEFLRETYALWIEAGVLTRGALKACDKALYYAYHNWVHRHPEDAVVFKSAPPTHFVADATILVERRRAADREAKARKREQAKQDKLSHLAI